jgi:acrylyl-CoA reductase (NADPH)
MFRALVVEKDDDGKTSGAVQDLDEARLPEGAVTVAVEYSTVNYKDGLCLGSGGGAGASYPHVPGIDFAGTVEASRRSALQARRQGRADRLARRRGHWGGYAEKARVKADWLVPLPEGLTPRRRWRWARPGSPRCWRSWRWRITG